VSRWDFWRAASMVLAGAGVGVAGYLTYTHYNIGALVCSVGDCHAVQTSQYATIGPVPIAILGLGMYVAVIALGVLRWRRADWLSTATMGAFALALAGTVYFAYLTYLEVAVIHAICQWCVTSAILTLGILVVEGVGTFRIVGTEGSRAY